MDGLNYLPIAVLIVFVILLFKSMLSEYRRNELIFRFISTLEYKERSDLWAKLCSENPDADPYAIWLWVFFHDRKSEASKTLGKWDRRRVPTTLDKALTPYSKNRRRHKHGT